ncbi:MAG TPA: hypothetical protein VFS67_26870 [Polyangiaceae bacterium]|nr:hypothetical protein [Polyangiaceae bacterium]
MTQELKTPLPPAASSPTAAGKRYLSQLMDYAFREGWRTPDDFVRCFPANAIMGALKSAPELRVKLLAAATGIYEEILRRKSPALAAEDLRIALEEGTTNSLQLLGVFSPEDRVRYLDPHRIWDFLAEDQFWLLDAEAGEEQRRGAVERMTFTLTQALSERLLTLRDVMDGVTYDAVADSLSPHELRAVVRFALVKGREGIGLNEKVLLEVLPLEKLVRSVPLDHIWNEVVLRRLAIPAGFTDLSREERRASQAERRNYSERRRFPSRPSAPPALPPEYARPLANDHVVTALPPAAHFAAPEAEYPPPSSRSPSLVQDEARTAAPPPMAMLREPPRPPHDGSLLPPPPSRVEAPRSGFPPESSGELTDDFNRPLPGAFRNEGPYGEPQYGEPQYAEPQYGEPQYAEPSTNTFESPVYDPRGAASYESAPRSAPQYESAPRSAPPSQPSSPRPISSAPPFDPSADSNEQRQRQRVIEHLRAIGRLPPNHPNLPAAVLRSIDAMYALLPSATDDIQRKSVIRQTFANENHLRSALLGLIELMDSSVDTSDPVIQGAKIEALIKILLFEEQRRKETGRFPTGGQSRSSAPLSFPPSSYGSGGYPGGSVPPGSMPPEAFPSLPPDGYFPSASAAPRVATQRPPPPLLGAVPGYPGSAPPLPNLPADPLPGRRRTVPPPLPPSYPRG